MRPLSPRLSRLTESDTIAMARRAAALRDAGIDVSPLSAGEPDFDTPPHIVDAMAAAARHGATRYPPVLGLPALRAAIAATHTQRYRVDLHPERVAVTPGAKFALWATFQAILTPGDEVILPAPNWVSYAPQIELAGGVVRPVACHPDDGWRLTPEALEAARTDRTVAIVLCSPNNPTGVTLDPDSARRIGALALAHDLWLVCDDLYAELIFESPHTAPSNHLPRAAPSNRAIQPALGVDLHSLLTARPELRDRVIIVDGLSKSHAMTGWRLGYLDAPPTVIDLVRRLLGQTLTGTTTFVQHGALAALTTPFSLAPMRHAYARRAARLVQALRQAGLATVAPKGGFCLLTDVRPRLAPGETSASLALTLLDRAHVATVAGEAFGAPGFLRLSFACSDPQLDLAIERLTAFFTP